MAAGEVLDVVCCRLLSVPVLVTDGLVVDGLMFSSTVGTFEALVFGLAEVSFGAKLNGVGVGAEPMDRMALSNFSPEMSTARIFCAKPEIRLQTLNFFFSMAALIRFE